MSLILVAVSTQVLAAAPLFDAGGRAIGPALSNRIASYKIDARLDPSRQQLTGNERLTWKNASDRPQFVLWFHLYWNAFRNSRSTLARETLEQEGFSGEVMSPSEYLGLKREDFGASDIQSIAIQGGADLTRTLRFVHPDDENADDRTVFTVTLPTPVAPGESVVLDIAWRAQVPKMMARTGRVGDYYFFGQWFPKIGVLEVPPTRGVREPTWNCHQFHATTEFYSDFGSYDVRMTVPSEMKLGASGVRVSVQQNPDGTTTYRHHQDDIHDFAWTAWRGFVEVKDVVKTEDLPEVEITLLLNPAHASSRQHFLDAIRSAITHYGRWWTPYPYSRLTLVDLPPSVSTSAMEYPTLVTVSAFEHPARGKDPIVWESTVHEFGHNFFYGLVASNEFEESWLDEGMTTYATAKLVHAENAGVEPEELLPRPLRALFRGTLGGPFLPDQRISAIMSQRSSSPIVTPAWRFKSGSDYGVQSYQRPAAALFTLERLLGEERFGAVMRAYVERWKFRHPGSEDFFAVLREVTGKDWQWFYERYFKTTGVLDYAVTALDCEERSPSVGILESSFEKAPDGAAKGSAGFLCKTRIERLGETRAPMDVVLTFARGGTQTLSWDAEERWKDIQLERPADDLLEKVEIDPKHAWLLESNRANNTRTVKSSARVPMRVFGFGTGLLQWMLSGLAGVWG